MSNADWKAIGWVGTLIGAVVIIHGLSSRNWRTAHTIGTALTIASIVGPRLRG
jgi:hypothetical protein